MLELHIMDLLYHSKSYFNNLKSMIVTILALCYTSNNTILIVKTSFTYDTVPHAVSKKGFIHYISNSSIYSNTSLPLPLNITFLFDLSIACLYIGS